MGRKIIKLDPKVQEVLVRAGVPYTLTNGNHHAQLRIGGVLVLVLPKDPDHGGSRQRLNALAHVKRFLRNYQDVK